MFLNQRHSHVVVIRCKQQQMAIPHRKSRGITLRLHPGFSRRTSFKLTRTSHFSESNGAYAIVTFCGIHH